MNIKSLLNALNISEAKSTSKFIRKETACFLHSINLRGKIIFFMAGRKSSVGSENYHFTSHKPTGNKS